MHFTHYKLSAVSAVLQTITLVAIIVVISLLSKNIDIGNTKTDLATVRATIQAALPKTAIKSVQPSFLDDIYEVVTEKGLLLTDKTGRYLFVGGIYDPITNKDVLLQRKKSLGFVSDNESSQEADNIQKNTQAREQLKAGPYPIDANKLKELEKYTITYKEVPGAPTVIELFDPMCSHCRTNHYATKELPVTIKLALIPTVGSDEINQQVFCAEDPKAAIDSLITSNRITTSVGSVAFCHIDSLQKIKKWLTENGIPAATPQSIIVDKNELWRGEATTTTWKNRIGLK